MRASDRIQEGSEVMRRLRSCFFTAVLFVVFVRTATAHHSFSAVYDDTRMLTVSGVVTQFRFVNPHAMMIMDVTDASGKVSKWTVEFAGSLNLSNVGWTAGSIKAGERVTVFGNPTHSGSER